VVLHTHPIYANAFSCMEGGERALASLLPARLAFVEYRTPGHLLGRAVESAANAHRAQFGKPARQMLLANHGLIAAGETVSDAIDATNEVLHAGQRFFGPIDERDFALEEPTSGLADWAAELQRTYAEHSGRGTVVRAARFRALHSTGCGKSRELPDPLVPDDVVCNGESVLVTKEAESAEDFIARHAESVHFSAAIAVPDKGFVFLAPGDGMIDAMEEQLLANVVLRRLIGPRGKCRPLAHSEIAPLLSMEQEKHRRSVLAGPEGVLPCRS
jgi:rhamnose utilization protein RhaD (predicted bifunctional aldolase and dehydrogenase)